MMPSTNFEFIRPNNPELADLGGFAEAYVQSDPASALVKLRQLGENLVADFYQHYGIQRLPKANFVEMLRGLETQNLVPPVILSKLHALRMSGNRAAHSSGKSFKTTDVARLLMEAFDLTKWYALTVHADQSVTSLTFKAPELSGKTAERERKSIQLKLAAQEAQMQQLLDELEEARSKAAAAEKTVAEQTAILSNAKAAASALHFDEATTRALLIDQQLVQAGWDVGPGDADTPTVKKELKVIGGAGNGKDGYADYVLMDADKNLPLAVIEAKRTSRDAQAGQHQARLYADGLEAMYGQRPVIFYTNGYDLYIWDDEIGDVPRRLYGYYSKPSLDRLIWNRTNRKELKAQPISTTIANRPYQQEAIRRVTERFEAKRRKALIVQATGTGKTRVAIAITDLLLRANWVKRVLFLCDRRELRKQAKNAYAEHISAEPQIYVNAHTANDRNQTIYLATYPAMSKYYQNFDVGFFDLVIADESHRSIYNRYRELFMYFDAFQLGLTATPRNIITHDTYRIFDCEQNDPTAHYSYNEAISHVPPYLAHFNVVTHQTKFLRDGIKYAEMTDDQRLQLEEQLDEYQAKAVDFDAKDVDKAVFNKDTDRRILRNLMDNGVRDAAGQHIGKTIVFARDHVHALQLQEIFEEEYPQYMKPKNPFCAIIDNYTERAEQLIDEFKGLASNDNLTIAISVDMMDTGIDVPAIVNLVFAKPVKSYVKFWQMIGRGTRLCENLFGPGQHKESFQIFDHWGNFEYFGESPPEVMPSVSKSLMQQVFEARLELAQEALTQQDVAAFELAVELIEKDVKSLPDDTVAVREKWRIVHTMLQPGVITSFAAATVGSLQHDIAPLMQWRDLDGREDAYRLDRLVARLQTAQLKGSGEFDDLKADLQLQVTELPINLQQVKDQIDWIKKVKSESFWETATVVDLDAVRRHLRPIMNLRNRPSTPKQQPLHIDVTDSDEESAPVDVQLDGLDLAAYRKRVESKLLAIFDSSPVLQQIKAGKPVDPDDIQPLIDTIMISDPSLHMDELLIHFPNKANRLDLAIRQIIGLDAKAVDRHFTTFSGKYNLTAHQHRFLDLVQRHIVNYGRLEIDRLYQEPFTQVHMMGVDGVFTDDAQIDDLLALIQSINDIAPAAI